MPFEPPRPFPASRTALLILAILLALPAAHAQGCAQCQDNLRATPPRTQAAYRRAILLMMAAGSVVFLAGAGAGAIRRFR